jgi:predicted amidohydrolase
MKTVRIAAAQTPEFRENMRAAIDYAATVIADASAQGASLVCFPEGFLQGYLTNEPSARQHALDINAPAFGEVLNQIPKTDAMIVMGMIEGENEKVFNTAVVLHKGAVVGRYRKTHLLKGERFFTPGSENQTFEICGLKFGVNICFDTNFSDGARQVADGGAMLLVCVANNMLRRETAEIYKDVHNAARGDRCRETGLWLISADVTGERDGRISWGPTAVLNPEGEVVAQLPLNKPGLLVFDIPCSAERTGAN